MFEGNGSFIERTREKMLGPREIRFSNGSRMLASIIPEPTVTLQSAKGMHLDLKSFAPEGTVIQVDPKGRWGASGGTVTYPPLITMGKFKGVDAILDFLHECGHLQDPVSESNARHAEQYYMENFFAKDANDHSSERMKALLERNSAVIQAERNAWAYSLKNTRKLEQQFGINIIEQMGGVSGVVDYVNVYLDNYEQRTIETELEYLGLPTYTRHFVEETLKNTAA